MKRAWILKIDTHNVVFSTEVRAHRALFSFFADELDSKGVSRFKRLRRDHAAVREYIANEGWFRWSLEEVDLDPLRFYVSVHE